MLKLLGIQIANGYSSEARVFASLLGNRAGAYEPLVLHQESPADTTSRQKFAGDSQARLTTLDFGWRKSPPGGHAALAKVGQFARLRATLPRAIRLAREFDPDIVYSNQQHWDCYVATEIARALGKPQVIHLHYIIGPWLRRQPLERLLTCDHVITVSDFIHNEALKYGVAPDRVTTVRNSMKPMPAPSPDSRESLRKELGIPADSPLVGIVARLDPGKGQDDTMEAFSQIAERFPTAHFLIVGEGENRPVLEAQAAKLPVRDRVIFTGRRSDIPRVLAALDLFSHPSRRDPCPLALLEACAAGLPVLAYAEGGACEIVVNSETGILAPAGDIEALARAMETLLENRDVAHRLGAAARARIATDFQPSSAGALFAETLRRISGKSLSPSLTKT